MFLKPGKEKEKLNSIDYDYHPTRFNHFSISRKMVYMVFQQTYCSSTAERTLQAAPIERYGL